MTAPPKTRRVRLAAGAKYAGVCTRTLRRWGAEGRLTLYRTGPRLIFVDLDELDELGNPVPTTAAEEAS